MEYKKLQLETILFNSEDIIATSGDTSDSPLQPAQPQPQPQPQPGTQDGQDNKFND
ncbi:hypothetical protein [Gemelliphila palaticanis]|uniref:Uncharacterized protein n=1 Tax=Gemelliphila palaticanis TaxID=81950 RepID=A0ABX2T0D9_9BACL|nr:hypothetical protein [Gemella palaticanis]MBF0715893.1 hypothetical protein [Gemella palaticanis]NYS47823.1 hypothetical protein [Gemella palaticanis]